MHQLIPRARLALMLLAAGLTACSGTQTTSPTSSTSGLDAARLNAGVTSVGNVQAAPAWQSFRMLGPAMGSSVGPAASVAAMIATDVVAGSPADPGAAALRARARLAWLLGGSSSSQVSLLPVIPTTVLGTTFVWDSVTAKYVADSTRRGAPANGVRYILYALNPVTAKPVVSAEIGHADLTDEGAAIANGVGIRLVGTSGSLTFLDYALTVTGAASTAVVNVHGYLSNGTDSLAFVVDGGLQAAQGAQFTAQLEVPKSQFLARATITSNGTVTNVQEQITVAANLVGFTATHDGDRVQAAVGVNGVPFATITGLAALPDIRRADGLPLTADEAKALRGILEMTGKTLDVFGDLLAPAGPVVRAAA
jgi:hypothetical protein